MSTGGSVNNPSPGRKLMSVAMVLSMFFSGMAFLATSENASAASWSSDFSTSDGWTINYPAGTTISDGTLNIDAWRNYNNFVTHQWSQTTTGEYNISFSVLLVSWGVDVGVAYYWNVATKTLTESTAWSGTVAGYESTQLNFYQDSNGPVLSLQMYEAASSSTGANQITPVKGTTYHVNFHRHYSNGQWIIDQRLWTDSGSWASPSINRQSILSGTPLSVGWTNFQNLNTGSSGSHQIIAKVDNYSETYIDGTGGGDVPPVTTTKDVTPSDLDTYERSYANYNTGDPNSWYNTTGSLITDNNVGHSYSSTYGGYFIARPTFWLPRSSIPTSSIMSASVNLYCTEINSGYADPHKLLVIQGAVDSTAVTYPNSDANYNQALWTGDLGSVDVYTITGGNSFVKPNTYINIEFNAAGIAYLQSCPGEYIPFTIRYDEDIDQVKPTESYWHTTKFNGLDSANLPYVRVTYGQPADSPSITSEPIEKAYTGSNYYYAATATAADAGQIRWELTTDATWLTADWEVGGATCNLSGSPSSTGSFSVSLRAYDDDSSEYQNYTLTVLEPGSGGIETFDRLANGTHDPNTITLDTGTLVLHNPSADEEVIALGGQLISFVRTDLSNAKVMTYTPTIPGSSWVMSSELYPSKDESIHQANGIPSSKYGMIVRLIDNGVEVAGVSLYVGEPSLGYENIKIYSAANSTWWTVVDDVLPGHANRHDPTPYAVENQEGMYGNKVDYYIVSYEYSGETSVVVSIHHSIDGVVSLLATETVAVSTPISDPAMTYTVDVAIDKTGEYNTFNMWCIDNLRIGSIGDRYAIVNPIYEYIMEDSPAYLYLRGLDNNPIADATVMIGGIAAAYVPERQRYEVSLGRSVNWAEQVSYSVAVDGYAFDGYFQITTMAQTANGISLPLWWNGWDWVSVIGVDDLSLSNAISTYSAYDHPVSSYMSTFAYTNALLTTQSEAGNHAPHTYATQGYLLWEQAKSEAASGMSSLTNAFNFASLWDDPSYVGQGDTYITRGCPANWGNLQMVYAMYEQGYRTMGRTGSIFSPMDFDTLGAWYGGAFYPYEPLQLMNINRNPCLDNLAAGWEPWVENIASMGGVVSAYCHGSFTSSGAAFLSWVTNPKTGFAYENWKATNGEVASYVNGRWTTDITYNEALSSAKTYVYDVSRRSPYASGYWNVPVTVAFDLSLLSGGLGDIILTEGAKTYRMSDGTLSNLASAREMGVGYDIRDNTLYVSHFWNDTSMLSITSETVDVPQWSPTFTSTPSLSGKVGTTYSYTPITNETSTLALEASPAWLSLVDGVLSGTPTAAGTYEVSLKAVSATGGLAAYQNWTIVVSAAPGVPTWGPTFTNSPLTSGKVGASYSYTAMTNETATFTLVSAPSWLKLTNGVLSGTPTAAGTYEVSLKAVSSAGTLSTYQNWTITVAAAPEDPDDGDDPYVPPTKPGGSSGGGKVVDDGSGGSSMWIILILLALAAIVIAIAINSTGSKKKGMRRR